MKVPIRRRYAAYLCGLLMMASPASLPGCGGASRGGGGAAPADVALEVADENSSGELGEAVVEFPESGDVLMRVTEEDGIGSATFFGTDNGPDLPPTITSMRFDTTDETVEVDFDSQGRPTSVAVNPTTTLTLSYNPDGTFNFSLVENGLEVLAGLDLVLTEDALASDGGATKTTAGEKVTDLDILLCAGDLFNIVAQTTCIEAGETNGTDDSPLAQRLRDNPYVFNIAIARCIMTLIVVPRVRDQEDTLCAPPIPVGNIGKCPRAEEALDNVLTLSLTLGLVVVRAAEVLLENELNKPFVVPAEVLAEECGAPADDEPDTGGEEPAPGDQPAGEGCEITGCGADESCGNCGCLPFGVPTESLCPESFEIDGFLLDPIFTTSLDRSELNQERFELQCFYTAEDGSDAGVITLQYAPVGGFTVNFPGAGRCGFPDDNGDNIIEQAYFSSTTRTIAVIVVGAVIDRAALLRGILNEAVAAGVGSECCLGG